MESGTDDYKVRFVLVQFKIASSHPFINVPHTAFHSQLHLLDVIVSHIYQDQAAKSFNVLPGYVRNCLGFNQFSKMTFKFLMKKVKDDLLA